MFSVKNQALPSVLSQTKLIAIDDNPLFLDLLEVVMKEIGLKRLIKATSVTEFLQKFREHKPEICIIDIELSPGKKEGGKLAFQLRKEHPKMPIIFLTSYFQQDYYDYVRPVKPISFMNKELSRLKILQAIELAINQIEERKEASLIAQNLPVDHVRTRVERTKPKQLFFKVGDQFKPISIEDIELFFADNKLTYARVDKRNYPTTVKLKELSVDLNPFFMRCHNKYLVNANKITGVNTRENTISVGEETIPIGYAFRKPFLEGLNLLK